MDEQQRQWGIAAMDRPAFYFFIEPVEDRRLIIPTKVEIHDPIGHLDAPKGSPAHQNK
jgi:hypothetical protein